MNFFTPKKNNIIIEGDQSGTEALKVAPSISIQAKTKTTANLIKK